MRHLLTHYPMASCIFSVLPVSHRGDAWQQYGGQIAKGTKLRTWLRLSFFKDVHLGMYENRPIYFPLSLPRKTL